MSNNNDPEYGDDKFKEYMEKLNSDQQNNDSLLQVLDAVKFKLKSISDVFGKSLDSYTILKSEDPLKEKLLDYITKLIGHSLQTLDQFSYILIDIDDDDTDNDEGE